MIMMAVVFTISLLVVNLIVELIPRRNRMIGGMMIRKDVIIIKIRENHASSG